MSEEYTCENMNEHKFLRDNGIRFSFVKKVNGKTQYKYIKTQELFKALTLYWSEHMGGSKDGTKICESTK